MDTAVIVALIAAVQAVGVAVIGGLFAYYNKRADTRASEAAEVERMREEIDSCMYDLVFASANALEVLLHKAHGDHVNGNVDDALESIKSAKSECNHLLNKHAARR